MANPNPHFSGYPFWSQPQSALCYLSRIGLAGLAIHAMWHARWADLIAVLAILPLVVWVEKPCVEGLSAVARFEHTRSKGVQNAKSKGHP